MSINYNKLTWVLTKEGINQIREVLANPESTLNLTTFKFGDANDDYYEPTGKETSLKHQCVDSEGNLVQFNVLSKSIKSITMSDQYGNTIIDAKGNPINYNTVNIHTILPENSCNYQILEVGLFGKYFDVVAEEEKEYLFALSTCSPIPKPDVLDNYIINIEYIASFISSNLLAIYNRINIDPNSQFVSEEEMTELSNSVLFATGNLAEQINQNSHILGLNRATQLKERIDIDKQNILINSNMLTYNSIKSTVGYDNLSDYWIFRDNGTASPINSVKDYGKLQNGITTSKTVNSLNPSQYGLAYTLNFSDINYYQITDTSKFSLSINKSFAFAFCIKFNELNETNTLLAQKDCFEIKKEYNENYGIRLVMNFYDSDGNAIYCFTPYWNGLKAEDLTTIIITYNGDLLNPIVNFFINLSCISVDKVSDISEITENTGGIIISDNFTEINNNTYPIASYTINNDSTIKDYINSQVSIISKIDNIFIEPNSTIGNSIILLLQSLMGQPTCLNL